MWKIINTHTKFCIKVNKKIYDSTQKKIMHVYFYNEPSTGFIITIVNNEREEKNQFEDTNTHTHAHTDKHSHDST